MDKLEVVRLALAELGDALPEHIVAFARERFGVEIDPKFVPVFKAAVRDRESLERVRQEARALALAAAAEAPPKAKGRKAKKRGDAAAQDCTSPPAAGVDARPVAVS